MEYYETVHTLHGYKRELDLNPPEDEEENQEGGGYLELNDQEFAKYEDDNGAQLVTMGDDPFNMDNIHHKYKYAERKYLNNN